MRRSFFQKTSIVYSSKEGCMSKIRFKSGFFIWSGSYIDALRFVMITKYADFNAVVTIFVLS